MSTNMPMFGPVVHEIVCGKFINNFHCLYKAYFYSKRKVWNNNIPFLRQCITQRIQYMLKEFLQKSVNFEEK